MKNLLKFILVFLIGFFIGAVNEYKFNETISQTDSNKKETIVEQFLESEDLYNAYTTNTDSANRIYLGKELMVTGKLSEQYINKNNEVVLSLLTPDKNIRIYCTLSNSSNQINTPFSKGQKIALHGICTGKIDNIMLNRCTLSNEQ